MFPDENPSLSARNSRGCGLRRNPFFAPTLRAARQCVPRACALCGKALAIRRALGTDRRAIRHNSLARWRDIYFCTAPPCNASAHIMHRLTPGSAAGRFAGISAPRSSQHASSPLPTAREPSQVSILRCGTCRRRHQGRGGQSRSRTCKKPCVSLGPRPQPACPPP